ncbi:MAG: 50S ribosomal protein L18 [Verrucomicrobiae bacterium]|nr:50S ribosomal protein L18 [Verrucomicrobiae bacterium]
MRPEKKQQLAQRRHWRVRKKVHGTPERPRMSVCFTNQHIYVQFIDDEAGRTLAAVSTRSKAAAAHGRLAANVASARVIGKLAAEAALARGIKQVVFDRGSARYHWSVGKDGQPVYGKVAALAQAAREAGLQF